MAIRYSVMYNIMVRELALGIRECIWFENLPFLLSSTALRYGACYMCIGPSLRIRSDRQRQCLLYIQEEVCACRGGGRPVDVQMRVLSREVA